MRDPGMKIVKINIPELKDTLNLISSPPTLIQSYTFSIRIAWHKNFSIVPVSIFAAINADVPLSLITEFTPAHAKYATRERPFDESDLLVAVLLFSNFPVLEIVYFHRTTYELERWSTESLNDSTEFSDTWNVSTSSVSILRMRPSSSTISPSPPEISKPGINI